MITNYFDKEYQSKLTTPSNAVSVLRDVVA